MSSKTPERKPGRPRIHAHDRDRWRAAQRAHRARRRQQRRKLNTLFSSASHEWYTPPHIIDNVLASVERNEFDLDPASSLTDGPIPARVRYTKTENGLIQPWFGLVWLNPPYGRQILRWIQKAVNEIQNGGAEQIILLLPARTDTQWWRELMDAGGQPEFLQGRLRFLQQDGRIGDASTFPSVLVRLVR